MAIRSEWVRYGAAATDRLDALVADAQAGDPLAPVTVLVPTNGVGVSARRVLGRRPGGVANVTFTTVDQLAHDIAGPGLEAHGRHLATDQIWAAAVRIVLRRDPHGFRPVADHPSTDRALADALATLRRAGPDAQAALARVPRALTHDLLAIGRQVDAALDAYYDESTLATVAATLVDPDGPVILYLPEWLGPAQRALVAALAERAPVTVLAGAVGDSAADAATIELCHRLAAPLGPPPVGAPDAPSAVREVSDPDDEARHAVRWLLARRAEGVPFERMAVLYTSAEPYRRALHRHLASAGVPNNGPAVGTVAETVAGRFVRAVLALVESGFHREQVIALVSSGPIVAPAGGPVRATLWDRATRRAGVVRGLDQWRDRIGARVAELLDGDPPPDSWRAIEAQSGADALAFVEGLAADLAQLDDLDSWAGFSAWLVAMLRRYLAPPGGRGRWPEHEREAAERLELTLELLSGLDHIEPAPSRRAMEAAVAVELDRPTRRTGHLGDGVMVGPLSAGVGADLDAVVVVGAVEGRAPRPVRHGVILGSAEHAAAGLDLGGDSTDAQLRRYLAALAAAPEHLRLVLTSRGDLRSGRLTFRSRWLEGAEAEAVPSAPAAWSPNGPEPAATVAEFQLRRLVDLSDAELARSPVVAAVPALAAGAALAAARRWGGLTEWTGLVAGDELGAVLERELSATPLERYATCPFSFFLADVLRVSDVEKPEELDVVDPRDRGSLLHRVFEQLIDERIARQADGLAVDESAERARLAALVDDALDELERSGRTGRALAWELEREAISGQAQQFFELDAAARGRGWRVEASELRFGGAEAPLEVELPSGRRLRLRGSADRVDRAPSGEAVVVDYKSVGKARKPAEVRRGIRRGRYLQLPLYARAVAPNGGGAQAGYWYLARKGGAAEVMVDLEEVDPWFTDALDVLTDGITAGAYPPVPGDQVLFPRDTFEHCAWCSYDSVCHANRDEIWARAGTEAPVARFVELTTRELPEDQPTDDGSDAP